MSDSEQHRRQREYQQRLSGSRAVIHSADGNVGLLWSPPPVVVVK